MSRSTTAVADYGTRVTTFLPGKIVKHYAIKDALLGLGGALLGLDGTEQCSRGRAIAMHIAYVYEGKVAAVDGLFDAFSAIDVARQERVPFLVLWYLLTQARDMISRSTLIPIGLECLNQMMASTARGEYETSAMITGIGADVASSILSSMQSFTGRFIHRSDDMTWTRRCVAFLSSLRNAGFRSTASMLPVSPSFGRLGHAAASAGMPHVYHSRLRETSVDVIHAPDSTRDWSVWTRFAPRSERHA
jgi:hypothetical protein